MDDVKRKIRLKWPFLSKNFEKYSSYWTDSALIEKPNILVQVLRDRENDEYAGDYSVPEKIVLISRTFQ